MQYNDFFDKYLTFYEMPPKAFLSETVNHFLQWSFYDIV